MTFTVPGEPLGVNALWRSQQGRVHKSPKAEQYAQAVMAHAAAARMRAGGDTLTGPVAVELRVYFGSERPDIDGPVKVILDAMQATTARRTGASVYLDDRQVHRLLVTRHVDRERPRVEVEVVSLERDTPARLMAPGERQGSARLVPSVRRWPPNAQACLQSDDRPSAGTGGPGNAPARPRVAIRCWPCQDTGRMLAPALDGMCPHCLGGTR